MGILSAILYDGENSTVTVDHDPTLTNTDVPAKSIIISQSTKCQYWKNSDGDNTDVTKM